MHCDSWLCLAVLTDTTHSVSLSLFTLTDPIMPNITSYIRHTKVTTQKTNQDSSQLRRTIRYHLEANYSSGTLICPMVLRSSATEKRQPVLETTSSTLTPSAISISISPSSLSTLNTHCRRKAWIMVRPGC